MGYQKLVFTKGMNSDVANEFLAEGEGRNRYNVRVMSPENSDLGVATTVNGNTLVAFTLPAGNNTCIGSKEYLLKKKSYHFIYNSSNNHSILEFDEQSNTVTKVLQTSILNFSITHLITGIAVIQLDVDNDLLYWTDNYNEPRKINIQKGKYFMAGNFILGYPTPFNAEFIYRIKQPMLLAPVTTYLDDTTLTINRLDKKLFQFKVQFVFDDKEVSSWSPISKTSFPNSTIVVGANNVIRVRVDTGTEIVKRIRIAVQQLNTPDFKLVVDLDKEQLGIASNITYNYLFQNDGNYNPLEINESIKLFDNVPRLSQSEELIKGNRMTDGLITEGFDAITPDLKLDLTFAADVNAGSAVASANVVSPGAFYSGGATAIVSGDGIGATASVTVVGGQVTAVNITFGGSGYTNATIAIFPVTFGTGAIATAILTNQNLLPVNALKRGGVYTYGIIYYDHGNRSGVTNINIGRFDTIQNDGEYGTQLFIPFYTEPVSGLQTIIYTGLVGTFVVGETITGSFSAATGIISISYTPSGGNGELIITSVVGTFINVDVITGGTSGATATVNSITQTSYGGSYPILNWSIYNEPPSWATHYQIARVKDSALDRFIQFVAESITYYDNKNVAKTFGDASITQFNVNILNITTSFKNANSASILVYDFVPGDRIRFIKDSSGNLLTQYIDFEIASYIVTSGNINVKFPPNSYPGTYPDAFPNLLAGTLFEIYHPGLEILTDSKITYEIACGNLVTYDSARGHYIHDGDINNQLITNFTSATYASPPTFNAVLPTGHGLTTNDNVKITTSAYSVYGVVSSTGANSAVITTNTTLVGTFNGSLSGTISKAATGLFDGGDTFYRIREMFYALGASTSSLMIEDANYSDLYFSAGYDYGRPNRIELDFREVTRPSQIYWSEAFIPDTNINGLSTIYDTSFESYEDKYGGIYKLYAEDQRLILFQELKVGAVFVEQLVIKTATGNNVVGQTEDILDPTIVYYLGELGIGQHPESFAVYGIDKYGIDVRRGVAWRLSNDGIIPVSDLYGQHNYFSNKCRLILANSIKVNIYGVFDIRFGEYVMAIAPFGVYAGETIAFNEINNAYSTFYTYIPEMMCMNGVDIISFKNGGLWTHNSNSLQNNFYNIQWVSEVWMVLNAEPSNIKIFNSIALESDAIWEVPSITNPNGQSTNIISADYQFIENQWFAATWQDINTPNVTAPALANGDPMRAQTFLVKLRYSDTVFSRLFVINCRYIISDLHNR